MKKKPEQPKEPVSMPAEPADAPVMAIPPKESDAAKACQAQPDDPLLTNGQAAQELENLKSEIAGLKKVAQERDEFLKLLQRVQADFENYQKRIRRDRECWEKYKHEDILKELLAAFDNLDRALKIECKSDDAKCILNGVGLSKQEIFRILDRHGVRPIKTIGEKFDPNYHEVAMAVESVDHPDGTIIEEITKGFMLYDRVIRPAKVRIAVNKKKPGEPKEPLEPPEAPTC